MKVTNTPDTIQFGWKFYIHSKITQKAVDELIKCPPQIAESADKSVIGEISRAILYMRTRIKRITPLQNGVRTGYIKHIENMSEAFKNSSNSQEGYKEAGRALHILQDMTYPGRNSFSLNNIFRRFFWGETQFQSSVDDIYQDVIDSYSSGYKSKSNTFIELFDETLSRTQTVSAPNKTNKNSWFLYTIKAIDISIDSTKRFLELLNK